MGREKTRTRGTGAKERSANKFFKGKGKGKSKGGKGGAGKGSDRAFGVPWSVWLFFNVVVGLAIRFIITLDLFFVLAFHIGLGEYVDPARDIGEC